MNLRDEINAFYYSTALCDLRLMNKRFVDQNMTYNSLLYLELIYAMNGTCTASKLAEMLYVSKPAVTLKINELIRQGFVTKTPDPNDHRQNLLSVNDEAVSLYRVYSKQDELAARTISERFSEEDVQKFCEMLRIFTDINFAEYHKEDFGDDI